MNSTYSILISDFTLHSESLPSWNILKSPVFGAFAGVLAMVL